MKNVILVLLLLLLTITCKSQNSYQYFKNDGFKINCDFKMRVNTTFIKIAKQQGVNNLSAAYICVENKDNPAIGSIANINVYDISSIYSRVKLNEYAHTEKTFIENYAKNLKNNGIKYKYVIYKGVSAIEYSFNQMELPTLAIIFIKNKKNYLIQFATRNKLALKYNNFKKSFDFF